MEQLIPTRYKLFSFLAILLFIASSCNKDMSMSLGSINEDLGAALVDSISAETATVQLEFIPTANTGTMLIGKIDQAATGVTSVSSYFRVALENFIDDIPEDARFDSLNLVLTPHSSRYFYGDTTQNQTIGVHRVLETIETNPIPPSGGINITPVYYTGPTIFSHQKFNYDAAELGSLTFSPRIKTLDTLNIRLDNALGQEIFDHINNGHSNVSSNTNFQQYLKGLVLVPHNQNSAIIGLNDTLFVNINYSYRGGDGFVKKGKKTIVAGSKNFQYNHIESDRTGTDYATLSRTNREIKSTVTNGNIFLQAGTGVVAKMEFPSLRQFLNEPNIAINKIELVIETTGTNEGAFPDPNSLMLFIANKHTGVPISFVRAPYSTNILTASMIPGNTFGKSSKYIFNLIDYIKTVNDPAFAETCLYLSVSSPNLFGTTQMAMVAKEDNKPKIKLNIVYTKFK